ncbi:MAG: hypothetical protein AAGA48_16325 [Myxococcota bacterium]
MSLETAIVISLALLLTLPIGWWASRSTAREPPPPSQAPRTLSPDERNRLLRELKVLAMRGEARASEAERVVMNSVTQELRREGLGPGKIDQLSDVAMHNLWVCYTLAFGTDAEAARVVASLPADVRANWSKIRSKIKRERAHEARRKEDGPASTSANEGSPVVADGPADIVQWLGTQGAAVWHGIGPKLKPDRLGYSPWQFLAEQPSLDRATAIAMFLGSQPQVAVTWESSSLTGAKQDQFKLLKTLAARLANDDFKSRSFGFASSNRSAYFKAQERVIATQGALPWPKLPPHALGPAKGGEPRCPFSVEGTTILSREKKRQRA